MTVFPGLLKRSPVFFVASTRNTSYKNIVVIYREIHSYETD